MVVGDGVGKDGGQVKKAADPEGGERAVITLDGKYLPTEPF